MERRSAILVTVCISLAISRAGVPAVAVDDVRAAYEAETDAYRANLTAAGFGEWLPRRDPTKLTFFLPPRDDANPAARETASEVLDRLRRERAERLYDLAKQAAEQGECTTAVQLAYETLHEVPDHEGVRKLLGYYKFNDRWVQAFEMAMIRAGSAWHPKFGWLKTEQVARYEAGERFANNRWISAADDAKQHATITNGWIVQTEHFRIQSNHSLERTVRLAEQLESLFHVWRQLFARYYLPDAAWKRLFGGADPGDLPVKRYPIVYYRSRDEYVAALKRREPQIELTSGIFMNDDHVAYFYADDDENHDSLVFHEATHQLFALARPSVPRIAEKGNFWITEGVACYMESLTLHREFAELGGVDSLRIKAARFRLLEDNFYVPLAELTTFSRRQLQQDERIAKLYSQSSGLSWFLLQADDGRYREATVDYLLAIYLGKDTPTTLAERTGAAYDELDRRYRKYLESMPHE